MSQDSTKPAPAKAPATHIGMANLRRPWQPGQSGNPTGRSQRYWDLFGMITAQIGGDTLSPMEREYISRAAENMRRAEHAKDNNERVRLTRCAMGLVDRVRDMRRERGDRKRAGRPPLRERIEPQAEPVG
jgi:hypothetical protein